MNIEQNWFDTLYTEFNKKSTSYDHYFNNSGTFNYSGKLTQLQNSGT